MKRSTFSEEQNVFALRQAEAGTPVGDLFRQLDEENNRLKWLVADLLLDEHMLSEALREKVYGPARRRSQARDRSALRLRIRDIA